MSKGYEVRGIGRGSRYENLEVVEQVAARRGRDIAAIWGVADGPLQAPRSEMAPRESMPIHLIRPLEVISIASRRAAHLRVPSLVVGLVCRRVLAFAVTWRPRWAIPLSLHCHHVR